MVELSFGSRGIKYGFHTADIQIFFFVVSAHLCCRMRENANKKAFLAVMSLSLQLPADWQSDTKPDEYSLLTPLYSAEPL